MEQDFDVNILKSEKYEIYEKERKLKNLEY